MDNEQVRWLKSIDEGLHQVQAEIAGLRQDLRFLVIEQLKQNLASTDGILVELRKRSL